VSKWSLVWMTLLGVCAAPSYADTTTGSDGNDQEWFDQTPIIDVDMFGTVAIAGLPYGPDSKGRAVIYSLQSDGHWHQTATLVPSDPDRVGTFGRRVTLANGRAVVASDVAIYLFVKQASGVWKQTDERTFKGGGVSELDWQGNTLVVGVPGNDTTPNYAFVYDTTNTTTLRKVTRIAPPDAIKTDDFGSSVAAHGSTVVVTAPGSHRNQGAAYLYTCGTSSCTQRQKFLAPDGIPGDQFGYAVDMNSNYVVVGAPSAAQAFDNETGYYQGGKVYVFTRADTHVTASQVIRPSGWGFQYFGDDLTIQGTHLLVGGGSGEYNGYYGHLYSLQLVGSTWTWWDSGVNPDELNGFSNSLIGPWAIVGSTTRASWGGLVEFFPLP
jgi:hypothetical protein